MRAVLASTLLSSLSLLLCVAVAHGAIDAGVGPNRVTSLPGLRGALADEMYTGRLPTGDTAGTSLFYWMAMARQPNTANASETPVVVWLQGGERQRRTVQRSASLAFPLTLVLF